MVCVGAVAAKEGGWRQASRRLPWLTVQAAGEEEGQRWPGCCCCCVDAGEMAVEEGPVGRGSERVAVHLPPLPLPLLLPLPLPLLLLAAHVPVGRHVAAMGLSPSR